MGASIQDVAREAKVSITTVSRVLNRNRSVREETRRRVEAVMRDLNYRPNMFARGLMLKRSNTVGLFLPSSENGFPADMILGASACARDLQQQLLVATAADGPDLCRQIEDTALRKWVDGIVAFIWTEPESVYQVLEQSGLPVVVVGADVGPRGFDNVRTDYHGGMQSLLSHLIAVHAVRRPVLLSGPADVPAYAECGRAYRDTMVANGLMPDTEAVQCLSPSFEAAHDFLAQRLRTGGYEPDAVVAANIEMGAGAMAAVLDAGRRIPDDVKVVAFGNSPAASWLRPALTTASVPIRQMGSRAVEFLLRRVHDPAVPIEQVVIPAELVIRRSCGCNP